LSATDLQVVATLPATEFHTKRPLSLRTVRSILLKKRKKEASFFGQVRDCKKKLLICRLSMSSQPGVNVMITIFGDFDPFSAEKIAIVL
jgi:hypothetical protein